MSETYNELLQWVMDAAADRKEQLEESQADETRGEENTLRLDEHKLSPTSEESLERELEAGVSPERLNEIMSIRAMELAKSNPEILRGIQRRVEYDEQSRRQAAASEQMRIDRENRARASAGLRDLVPGGSFLGNIENRVIAAVQDDKSRNEELAGIRKELAGQLIKWESSDEFKRLSKSDRESFTKWGMSMLQSISDAERIRKDRPNDLKLWEESWRAGKRYLAEGEASLVGLTRMASGLFGKDVGKELSAGYDALMMDPEYAMSARAAQGWKEDGFNWNRFSVVATSGTLSMAECIGGAMVGNAVGGSILKSASAAGKVTRGATLAAKAAPMLGWALPMTAKTAGQSFNESMTYWQSRTDVSDREKYWRSVGQALTDAGIEFVSEEASYMLEAGATKVVSRLNKARRPIEQMTVKAITDSFWKQVGRGTAEGITSFIEEWAEEDFASWGHEFSQMMWRGDSELLRTWKNEGSEGLGNWIVMQSFENAVGVLSTLGTGFVHGYRQHQWGGAQDWYVRPAEVLEDYNIRDNATGNMTVAAVRSLLEGDSRGLDVNLDLLRAQGTEEAETGIKLVNQMRSQAKRFGLQGVMEDSLDKARGNSTIDVIEFQDGERKGQGYLVTIGTGAAVSSVAIAATAEQAAFIQQMARSNAIGTVSPYLIQIPNTNEYAIKRENGGFAVYDANGNFQFDDTNPVARRLKAIETLTKFKDVKPMPHFYETFYLPAAKTRQAAQVTQAVQPEAQTAQTAQTAQETQAGQSDEQTSQPAEAATQEGQTGQTTEQSAATQEGQTETDNATEGKPVQKPVQEAQAEHDAATMEPIVRDIESGREGMRKGLEEDIAKLEEKKKSNGLTEQEAQQLDTLKSALTNLNNPQSIEELEREDGQETNGKTKPSETAKSGEEAKPKTTAEKSVQESAQESVQQPKTETKQAEKSVQESAQESAQESTTEAKPSDENLAEQPRKDQGTIDANSILANTQKEIEADIAKLEEKQRSKGSLSKEDTRKLESLKRMLENSRQKSDNTPADEKPSKEQKPSEESKQARKSSQDPYSQDYKPGDEIHDAEGKVVTVVVINEKPVRRDFPNRKSFVTGYWAVVEADATQVSRNIDGVLQNRSMDSAASRAAVADMVSSIRENPAQILDEKTIDHGATTVVAVNDGNKGTVFKDVFGNHRDAALQQAYENEETAAKLKETVDNYLKEHGQKTSDELGIRHPKLVFIQDKGKSIGELQGEVQKGNHAATRQMSPSQNALSDSLLLEQHPELMRLYIPGGNLNGDNREFFLRFMELTDTQNAGMVDENGRPTQAAYERISRAMFAYFLRDEPVARRERMLTTVIDNAGKNNILSIVKGLMDNAATLARNDVENPEYSIGKEIINALDSYLEFKRHAAEYQDSIDNWFNQLSMFEDDSNATPELNDMEKDIARIFDKVKSAVGIRRFFSLYNDKVRQNTGESLFADVASQTKQEIIHGMVNAVLEPQGTASAAFVGSEDGEHAPRVESAREATQKEGALTQAEMVYDAVRREKRRNIDKAVELAKRLFPKYSFTVYETQEEMAPEHSEKIPEGGVPECYIDTKNGHIYIIADNMPSDPKEIRQRIMSHEIVGHDGMKQLLGKRYDSTLDFIFRDHRKEIAPVAAQYKYNLGTRAGRRMATEEWLAHIADIENPPTWFNRIVARFRETVRKLFNIHWSDNDIKALIASASRNLQKTQGASGIRFSLSNLFTGSAADYDQPSLHYVGTGEGAQVYGWGLYASDNSGIASWYAEKDARNKYGYNEWLYQGQNISNLKTGWANKINSVLYDNYRTDKDSLIRDLESYIKLYQYRKSEDNPMNFDSTVYDKLIADTREAIEKVRNGEVNYSDLAEGHRHLYNQTWFTNRVNDGEANLLEWNKKVTNEQLDAISNALSDIPDLEELSGTEQYRNSSKHRLIDKINIKKATGFTGETIYTALAEDVFASPRKASEFLFRAGIDGIRYPANHGDGRDGWNYVSFSDTNMRVDEHISWSIAPADYKPKQTYHDVTGKWMYKTMRLVDGHLEYPMAGTGVEVPIGVWLQADDNSVIDEKTGKRITPLEFGSKKVNQNGKIARRPGTAAPFPGFHAGTLPYMAHIGLGGTLGQKHFQNADYVWVQIDAPYDRTEEYAEKIGDKDPDKVMRGIIPENGMYWRKTNPNMKGKWGVMGQMKIVKVLSDDAVDALLDKELPDRFRMGRQGGGRFNAETMSIEGQDLANWNLEEEEAKINNADLLANEAIRAYFNNKGQNNTQDSNQLEFDFDYEQREETLSEGERRSQEDARRDAVDCLRRCNGTLLGLGITKDFKSNGTASLVGQRIASPSDLADAAQIFRNPHFETLRYIFVKNGEVVYANAVTSRMPGSTVAFIGDASSFLSDLKKQFDVSGADGYYLLHNHPSGKVSPSAADRSCTEGVVKKLGKGFLGHIVIDHEKYGIIDRFGGIASYSFKPSTDVNQYDPEKNPSLPHSLLGMGINAADVLAIAANKIQAANSIQNGSVILFGTNPAIRINCIATIPMDDIKSFGDKRIYAMARQLGRISASSYFFLGNVDAKDSSYFEKALQSGLLVDAVLTNGTSLRQQLRLPSSVKYTLGLRINAKSAITENTSDVNYSLTAEKPTPEDPESVETGEYADRTLIAIAQTPIENLRAMRLPLVLELARQLKGDVTAVDRIPRIFNGQALGVFRRLTRQIEVLRRLAMPQVLERSIVVPQSDVAQQRKLWQDYWTNAGVPASEIEITEVPVGNDVMMSAIRHDRTLAEFRKVAGHEIGHLIDYNSGNTTSHGNVLGTVGGMLQRWLLNVIGETPSTQIDRAELKKMRKELRKQAEAYVNQYFPKPPSSDPSIENWRTDVSVKYQELFEEECDKNGWFRKAVVREEMVDLTRWWSGDFEPTTNYGKYRMKPTELFAETMSVLLNAPDEFMKRSPETWRMIQNYQNNKADFHRAWRQLMDLMNDEKAYANSLLEIQRRGFDAGEVAALEALKEKPTFSAKDGWDAFKRMFVNKFANVAYASKRLVKNGQIVFEDTPLSAITAAQHASVQDYYMKLANRLTKPLMDMGMTEKDIGLYMQNKRIENDPSLNDTDRGILNPNGLTADDARLVLKELHSQLGDEKWNALEKWHKEFWKLRQDTVIQMMEDSGAYSKELLEHARDNEWYAYRKIVSTLYGRNGASTGGMMGRIYGLKGTVSDAANPLAWTFENDLRIMAGILWNTARMNTVDMARQFFPTLIQRPTVSGEMKDGRIVFNDAPEGFTRMYVMRDGRIEQWDVANAFAAGFRDVIDEDLRNCFGVLSRITNWFRMGWTTYSPTFVVNNVIRDYFSSYNNMTWENAPGLMAWTKYWARGMKEAFGAEFGGLSDVVEEMERLNMFQPAQQGHGGVVRKGTELERLMAKYDLSQEEVKRLGEKTIEILKNPLKAYASFMERIVSATERGAKVGGYLAMTERNPSMTIDEKRYHIVKHIGSPDFATRGTHTFISNAMFIFSNAAVQGWSRTLESAKSNPGNYAARWMTTSGLSTILTWGMESGAMLLVLKALGFDDDDDIVKYAKWMKQMYGKITHYHRFNYMCLPVAETEDGQCIFIRLPYEENSRVPSMILKGLLESAYSETPKSYGAATETTRAIGSLGTNMNPYIAMLGDLVAFAMGWNVYDRHFGIPRVNPTQFAAGGWERTKGVGSYMYRSYTPWSIGKWDPTNPDPNYLYDTLGTTLGFGALVRVTKAGEKESERENKAIKKQQNAQKKLEGKKK